MKLSLLVCVIALYAAFGIANSQEVVWHSCLSEGKEIFDAIYKLKSNSDLPLPINIDCADIEVPLDWNNPSGKKINSHMTRVVTNLDLVKNHSHVWILNGGPGDAGSMLLPFAAELLAEAARHLYTGIEHTNFLLLDHRGTGLSNGLNCTAPKTPLDCAKEVGDDFQHFTVTNAALDLAHWTDLISRPNKNPFYVYGASYGTYWAQRYLQLRPNEAAGVILDGVCAAKKTELSKMDNTLEQVGRSVLSLCAQDKTCAAAFSGTTPVDALTKIYAMIDSKTLPCLQHVPNLNHKTLQFHLGVLLPGWPTRSLVGPLIFRTLRCNADDQKVLNKYFANTTATLTAPGPNVEVSLVLGYHIILSELFTLTPPPPPASQMEADSFKFLFAMYEGADMRAQLYDAWPRYKLDSYYNKYPDIDVPLLILNGELDTQTAFPWAQDAAKNLIKANHTKQSFVAIPEGTHVTLIGSPVTDFDLDCGLQVFASFLWNKDNKLNLSCLNKLEKIDFAATSTKTKQQSQKIFGTSDAWGN